MNKSSSQNYISLKKWPVSSSLLMKEVSIVPEKPRFACQRETQLKVPALYNTTQPISTDLNQMLYNSVFSLM